MQNQEIEKLAETLIELFYPMVEITFFQEKTLKKIWNPFSSNQEDQKIKKTSEYESLTNGKKVKSRFFFFHEKKESLRFRFDLSFFHELQDKLDLFLEKRDFSSKAHWQNQIDEQIKQYLQKKRTSLEALKPNQKREFVLLIQEKGFFDFKESSSYLAKKLNLSRATIYNYLKTAKDLTKVAIHQVDTFTEEKFKGNPAGVVLDASDLDKITMQKIAKELNLSETSFVSKSEKGDFCLRYFTPTGHEVGFCGHSTVGALYMIAKERILPIKGPGCYPLIAETLKGLLKMEVELDHNAPISLMYETPDVDLEESLLSHEEFSKISGIEKDRIDPFFPILFEKTNQDLFILIRSLEDLKNLDCDFRLLSSYGKKQDVVAFCFFTLETFDPKNLVHMRVFAPSVGILEDPFTGSVLGGLAAFLDRFHLLKKNPFGVEQGHFLGRPGQVNLEWKKEKNKAHVFAKAIHCFSSEIQL